jgi:hypothetical protein
MAGRWSTFHRRKNIPGAILKTSSDFASFNKLDNKRLLRRATPSGIDLFADEHQQKVSSQAFHVAGK